MFNMLCGKVRGRGLIIWILVGSGTAIGFYELVFTGIMGTNGCFKLPSGVECKTLTCVCGPSGVRVGCRSSSGKGTAG